MHHLAIDTTIAQKRREAGITQKELAARLGVTKAAVSKWELGQSLPDVALLPRIAAYFGITLDELCGYRPQLSKEEIKALYLELLEQFAADPATAYERLDALVADYYSCWPFLAQMASLYLWRTTVEPERVPELAEKAFSLLERVEAQCEDAEVVLGAKLLRASSLTLTGETDTAIALMESLRPAEPFAVNDILASLYGQMGNRDACLRIQQESLLWGGTAAFSSISSQLSLYAGDMAVAGGAASGGVVAEAQSDAHAADAHGADDTGAAGIAARAGTEEHIEALLRAGEGMLVGFALAESNPVATFMFWGEAATACLCMGDHIRAVRYLESFVDGLEKTDITASVGGLPSLLYDRIPEMSAPDAATVKVARAQFGSVDMKGQLRDYALRSERWDEVAEDVRFRPLLDRLRVQ